jgi:hypothetical protein
MALGSPFTDALLGVQQANALGGYAGMQKQQMAYYMAQQQRAARGMPIGPGSITESGYFTDNSGANGTYNAEDWDGNSISNNEIKLYPEPEPDTEYAIIHTEEEPYDEFKKLTNHDFHKLLDKFEECILSISPNK